jgi:hypothetical protein
MASALGEQARRRVRDKLPSARLLALAQTGVGRSTQPTGVTSNISATDRPGCSLVVVTTQIATDERGRLRTPNSAFHIHTSDRLLDETAT